MYNLSEQIIIVVYKNYFSLDEIEHYNYSEFSRWITRHTGQVNILEVITPVIPLLNYLFMP